MVRRLLNAITARLHQMSLRVELMGGFALIVGLTVLVGGTSLVSQNRSVTAVNQLINVDNRVAELSAKSIAALLKARRAEKDFLLLRKEYGFQEAKARYITLLRSYIADIHHHMGEIRALNTTPQIAQKTKDIEAGAADYEDDVLKSVELYGRLGYVDFGLEGKLRDKAHAIEQRIGAHNQSRLMVHLLSIRRSEKDFIVRGTAKYAKQVEALTITLKTDLARTPLPANEKTQIQRLTDEYLVFFKQYVDTSRQIDSDRRNYLAAANKIEPQLDTLYLSAGNDAEATRNRVHERAQTTTWAIIAAISVALLIGSMIAIFVSRAISTSVRDSLDFARRVAEGDFSLRLTARRGREFLMLSSALNKMADALHSSTLALKERAAAFEHQSTHDMLTGLPNRGLMHERIDHDLGVARRNGAKVVVAFLDLDHFKFINDSLGHGIGDELLITISQRLLASIRDIDFVARIGGDEFVLIFPVAADPLDEAKKSVGFDINHQVLVILRRIVDQASKPLMIAGRQLQISCSIGACVYPQDGKDPETLLQHADTALYRVKEQGRNGFQFFAEEMNVAVNDRMTLQAALRNALRNEEFTLHYQPKIDLITGRITGVEALLRWHNAELGSVPPVKFIPILEEMGLIIDVGRWVIERAALQHRTWVRTGAPAPRIAINVSEVQLRREDFIPMLREIINNMGGGNIGLDIEMTESYIMRDITANIPRLQAIREMGIGIAIDDFGTGYSSLSYLAHLPLDVLKIDRGFITGLHANSSEHSIVGIIVALAQAMNLKVVAEGVETVEQRQLLTRLGCDEMQGYLICMPMPDAAYQAWQMRYEERLSAAAKKEDNHAAIPA